ncbi:uncharacterized protein LOC133889957 [Phragmites australis]|uniref:uncharacterized protein LOC133889957 n=1 Tax=Phragmites australis TaxID=29695 RepID=UPI002D783E84|nr:uncharacterized protein LOC133889957 [Phragmites australis]
MSSTTRKNFILHTQEMAPSKCIVALFLAFTLLTNALQTSQAIRAQAAFKPAAAIDQEASEKAATASTTSEAVAQSSTPPGLPGLPGAPAAGSLPGIPGFPLLRLLFPSFPWPGAPQARFLPGTPGFQWFPPLPLSGPLPAGQLAGILGFPFFPSLPLVFPFPGVPSHIGSPVSSAAPPPSSPNSPAGTTTTTSPSTPPQQPTDCLSPLMGLTPCMDYLTNTSVPVPPSTCCDGFKSLVNDAPICLCHGLKGDINQLTPAPTDFMRMMSLPTACGATLPMHTLAKCSTQQVPPLMPAPTPAAAPSLGN